MEKFKELFDSIDLAKDELIEIKNELEDYLEGFNPQDASDKKEYAKNKNIHEKISEFLDENSDTDFLMIHEFNKLEWFKQRCLEWNELDDEKDIAEVIMEKYRFLQCWHGGYPFKINWESILSGHECSGDVFSLGEFSLLDHTWYLEEI